MFFKRNSTHDAAPSVDEETQLKRKEAYETQLLVDQSFERLFCLMAETLIELSEPKLLTDQTEPEEPVKKKGLRAKGRTK